ncbi:hypothetical protein E1161_17000 [Saccharopolyspora aridisoli]|uniref:DUF3558 domain-containing protein n=1 Tax=Saccharopolyspora aridisoli TaxID=2530385 RepID=A0A4R4UH43_9PSEU|nr:hypothetical protein [Saccharopolyspora aridisoli]TDC91137.1 hypothetical protein E1161_17000 [Saccharopolyspora aridisoli]
MMKRIAVSCVSAIGAALLLAPPATAADEPTVRELLEKCDNGTDSCVFHPEGEVEYYQNSSEAVGSPVFNCTDKEQMMNVAWSDSTAESNSVGLSMSTSFGEVFKVTFKATYGHEWRSEHTESQTTFITVRPGEVGQVYHGPKMQKAKGTYELHFEDKFYDHYIWYVNDFEASGPADDQGGTVTQSTRAMTEEEEQANCG